MISKNKWTLLASALVSLLAFVVVIDVISLRSRFVTLKAENQEGVIATSTEQENPAAEPLPAEEVPVTRPEPKELILHTVSFVAPEGVTVDQMTDTRHGPVATNVNKVKIPDGSSLFFSLNYTAEEMQALSVLIDNTGEELRPAEGSGARPVYSIQKIKSALTVRIDVMSGQEDENEDEQPVITHTETHPTDPQQPVYTYTTKVIKPTCTEKGYTLHKCVEDPSKSFKDSYTAKLGHKWGGASYVWSGDLSIVTGTVVCKRDSSHTITQTVHTTSAITKQPTCTENGVTTFTAVFSKDSFTTQTKSIKDIPALGHDYFRGRCRRCGEKQPADPPTPPWAP